MIRYAVKFEHATADTGPHYEAIGTGSTNDKQFAHLYTTLELAQKKARQYRAHNQWYKNVEVIDVEVIWP